jgi:hypothetical protein
MAVRAFILSAALAIALAGMTSVPIAGQHAGASPGTSTRIPRAADGHPNLEGFWTNDSFTPLERAPELGDKEFFTQAEAAAYFAQRMQRLENQSKTDIHYDDALWQAETYAKEQNPRTSIVFDPKNGRLPPLTAEAQRRDAERIAAARQHGPADSAQARTPGERCITWGNVGPPMLPPTYNANFQIVQTPDIIILRHEMIHEARLIYTDGSPHLPDTVRLLGGDARGRWDGDTLVVDTSNFTNLTNFRGSPQTTRQDIFASDALHVVERFTMIDPTTLVYRFTVDDPKTWTASWSGEMPIRRWDGPIYEYACHEGNYGLANILRAARIAEQRSGSR